MENSGQVTDPPAAAASTPAAGPILDTSAFAEDCRVCGRLVLPAAGHAIDVPARRHLVVNWTTGPAEFAGRLHFACLSGWEHRAAFRDALETLLRRGDAVIAFTVDGQRREVAQRGFHYPDEIFSGATCQVLQSDRSDSWVVLERDGAAHQVSFAALQQLAAGRPARSTPTVHRTRLNVVPTTEVPADTWTGLLEHLGLTDRYPGTVADETTYRYADFQPADTTLEYTLETTLPLPAEAVAFLRGYADDYLPIDQRIWDTADVWDRTDVWERPAT
jgi:hypothetical protein